jgi:hypothetical protein
MPFDYASGQQMLDSDVALCHFLLLVCAAVVSGVTLEVLGQLSFTPNAQRLANGAEMQLYIGDGQNNQRAITLPCATCLANEA